MVGPPDFGRPVQAVLGLPFDAIDEAQAEAAVRDAAERGRRCFLSTPNLNFAVACLQDEDFRLSVLRSDLCVADGWPVLMAARLVGATLPGRVAGSGLFERLRSSTVRPPVKVFFFGGPPGVAARAQTVVNRRDEGVHCVGVDEAGFGDVKAMSSAGQIDRINASGAGFLVVALGARKGQSWIRHNLPALTVPVVSHLGAVVNFVAGTVSRAPRWVQAMRGEWLWRILQEPQLYRRYRDDGLAFARLLLRDALPFWLGQRASRRVTQDVSPSFRVGSDQDGPRLMLVGRWRGAETGALRQALQSLVSQQQCVSVDLTQALDLDPTVLGLLMLLHGWNVDLGRSWTVVDASPDVTRSLQRQQAAYLLRR